MTERVLVGLSGGVDSAIAAYLLIQQGYRVEAAFMRNWDDDGGKYCTAQEDFLSACQVADHLGIPLETVNFTQEYKQQVFARSLDMLNSGQTPNPDVWCNRFIKFGAFLEHAKARKMDWLATGHYVRKQVAEDGTLSLCSARDDNKDQSYFLHQITYQQLAKSLFPLGDLPKPEVREIARSIGLPNAERKDSTGICFIGERPFAEFLKDYIQETPGPIVDENNQNIGQHCGLAFYTIGQRKGLQLGGVQGKPELPWFVAQKKIETNTLVVVQGEDHPLLYSKGLRVEQMHWIANDACRIRNVVANQPLSAKMRHRQKEQDCSLQKVEENEVEIVFEFPQKAVTQGQFAVLYSNGQCLGGGVIANVW